MLAYARCSELAAHDFYDSLNVTYLYILNYWEYYTNYINIIRETRKYENIRSYLVSFNLNSLRVI